MQIRIQLLIFFMLATIALQSQEKNLFTRNHTVASNIKLLEKWIETQIEYGKMPGVSVAIVYDGQAIYQKGFGYADLEKKIPATADTKYRIASHSKMFTAIGIMILKEAGKLRLDDAAEKYLDWLTLTPLSKEDLPITIRQLMNHSSGMVDYSKFSEQDYFPTKEDLRSLPSEKYKLVFPSNSTWKYSNNAYLLLGEIIEAVSGMSYEKFITDKILKPLQMNSTHVAPDKSNQTLIATGYSRKFSDGSRKKYDFMDAKAGASMGGMASDVNDLSKFILWQMRLLSTNKSEVISAATFREMLNDQFTDNGISWGLGFGVFKKVNKTYFGHSGFYFGYNSQTTFNPVDKIGVTVCVNSNDGEPYIGFPWSISDRIYEWLTEVLKSVNKNDITTTLPDYSVYEGRYSNVLSDKLVIHLEGKLQILDPYSPDPKATSWIIERITGDTFRITSAPHFAPIGELLIFKRDSTGKILGFNEGEAAKWSEKME